MPLVRRNQRKRGRLQDRRRLKLESLESRRLLTAASAVEAPGFRSDEIHYNAGFVFALTNSDYQDRIPAGNTSGTGQVTWSSPQNASGKIAAEATGNGSSKFRFGDGFVPCSTYGIYNKGTYDFTVDAVQQKVTVTAKKPLESSYTFYSHSEPKADGCEQPVPATSYVFGGVVDGYQGTYDPSTFQVGIGYNRVHGPSTVVVSTDVREYGAVNTAETTLTMTVDPYRVGVEVPQVSGPFEETMINLDQDAIAVNVDLDGKAVVPIDGNVWTPVAKVKLFWAEGEVPEGTTEIPIDHSEHLNVYWNSTSVAVELTDLPQAPQGTTHVIVKLDVEDEIGIADSQVALEIEALQIKVTAEYDDDDREKVFGSYIENVELTNTFTVDFDEVWPGQSEQVTDVSYRISADGIDPGEIMPATKTASGSWEFDYDVGMLQADEGLSNDRSLIVIAKLGGEEIEYHGTLQVIDGVGFAIDVPTKADGTGRVYIDQIRLIEGHGPELEYTVSILKFPLALAGNPYANKLQLVYRDEASGEVNSFFDLDFDLKEETTAFFKHLDAGSKFKDVIETAGNDYTFFLAERGEASSADRIGTENKGLLVTALPAWMGAPTEVTYEKSEDVQAAFGVTDPNLQSYIIELSIPSALSDQTFAPEGNYAFGLFDGLESSIDFGLKLTVFAQLLKTPLAKVRPNGWTAEAKVFGKDLFEDWKSIPGEDPGTVVSWTETLNQLIDGEKLKITGGLIGSNFDLKELSIEFETGNLVDELAQPPAFDFSVPRLGLPIPVPISVLPTAVEGTLDVSVNGSINTASLSGLLKLELKKNTNNKDIIVFGAGSHVTLYTNGVLGGQAIVGAGATVLGYTVIRGEIVVTASMNVDAKLKLDLSDPLTSPNADFSNKSLLNIYSSYDIDFRGCLLQDMCISDAPALDKVKDITKRRLVWNAFDLKAGVGLENPGSLNLYGKGDLDSIGYLGVGPTEGESVAILGDAATRPEGEIAVAETTELSTLEVNYLVPTDVQAIQFDLNAIANRANLTPGAHVLELHVVPDSGGESLPVFSQDLSVSTYSPNDNPLGYASGWQTTIVEIADGVIDPTVDYFLEFRLSTESDGGQAVAVALDRLQFKTPVGRVELPDPSGVLADGRIEFGVETAGSNSFSLTIENTGDTAVIFDPIELQGSGFSVDQGNQEFGILSGRSATITVTADPAVASTGVMRLRTDDLAAPLLEFELVAGNEAPAITAFTSSATLANRSADGEVTVRGDFVDADWSDTHVAVVNWGDGSASEAVSISDLTDGAGSFTGSHTYADGGVFEIDVTLTDSSGNSVTSTTPAVVTGLGVVDGVLQIVGSESADVLVIHKQGDQLRVRNRIGGQFSVDRFALESVSRINVDVAGGKDFVYVSRQVELPTFILGGDGNDFLQGGGQSNLIVGGAGRDSLLGRSGRDLLIGGQGRDLILGRRGEDLLVGDQAANSQAELQQILSAWNGSGDFSERSSVVRPMFDLVDDGAFDFRIGGPGLDLILAPTSAEGETTSLAAGASETPATLEELAEFGIGVADSNPIESKDVNGDGRLSVLDALQIINDLSRSEPRQLDLGVMLTACEADTTTIAWDEGHTCINASSTFFPDTNADGVVSVLDALLVINQIQRDRSVFEGESPSSTAITESPQLVGNSSSGSRGGAALVLEFSDDRTVHSEVDGRLMSPVRIDLPASDREARPADHDSRSTVFKEVDWQLESEIADELVKLLDSR